MLNILFERFLLPIVPEEHKELANKLYDATLWFVFLALLAYCILKFKPEFYAAIGVLDFYVMFYVFCAGIVFTLWFQSFIPSKKFEVSQTDVILRRSVLMVQALIFGIIVLIFVFNPQGVYFQIAKHYAQDTIGIPKNWTFWGQTDNGGSFYYVNNNLFLKQNEPIALNPIYMELTRNQTIAFANGTNYTGFFFNNTIPTINAPYVFNKNQ